MTETEQQYAQIEKEALALTWACERLSQYLIGSKFTLETDHKPLIPLLSTKNLDDLPFRIQRFHLRMMPYHYDIIHVSGKDLHTADFLSREPLKETGSDELRNEVDLYVHHILSQLPISDTRLQQIQDHQETDPVLKRWISQITGKEGGKKKKDKISYFSDLSIMDGLLMKGNRIVIPQALQSDILDKLHTGHQGLVKCKERARISVWWPGINNDIECYIKKCKICCQSQQPKFEPMIASELPSCPWQKVGTDLFMWKQKTYLLVVDYYSRFIEIARLSSLTSDEVITHLKSIFARHGIPQYVVSDNGTQYSSQLFSNFSKSYGFKHITSSPHYPQSNGEAERAVQTMKRLLDKSTDPYLTLLAYRSTPLKLGYSPAELLMGRNLRTTLPTANSQFKAHTPDEDAVKKRDKKLKESQRKNYNHRHRAKEQSSLITGDLVWITDLRRQGTIIREESPRSYTVQTHNGIIRRNQRHLNNLPEDSNENEELDYSSDSSDTAVEENSHDSQSTNTIGARRSTRPRRPPDRYGVWLNDIQQTGERM